MNLSLKLDPKTEEEEEEEVMASPQIKRNAHRSRTVPARTARQTVHPGTTESHPMDVGRSKTRLLALPIMARNPRSLGSRVDVDGSPVHATETEPAPRVAGCLDLPSPAGAPSAVQLAALFDALMSAQGIGNDSPRMALNSLSDAIVRLNSGFSLGLAGDDAPRLLAFLRSFETSAAADENVVNVDGTKAGQKPSGDDTVTREAFVKGLRLLSGVLRRVGKKLSLREIKVVLRVAFQQYDLNDDGRIELDEFTVAAQSMGVAVEKADLAVLHSFLTATTHCKTILQDDLSAEPPIWEKWITMLQEGVVQVKKKSGWGSFHDALDRAHRAAQQPGSPRSQMQRAVAALWSAGDGAHDAFELADFAVETSSLAIAGQYVASCIDDAIQSHSLHELDFMEVAPFLMFAGISAVNVAKHLDGLALKDMNENEALLFAQHFHHHGFTQAEFRHLLDLKGCRWVTVGPGEVLNTPCDNTLKFVVKGSAEVRSCDTSSGVVGVAMPLHATVGETLFLRGRRLWSKETIVSAESVTYVSWDIEHLRGYLNHHRQVDLRMGNLLAETMAANLEVISSICLNRPKHTGGLSEMVNADCDASPQASPLFWHRRKRGIGTPTSFKELFRQMDMNEDGTVGRAELAAYLEYLDGRLGLGTSLLAKERLFAFLDIDLDGRISEREFLLKMSQLEGCMKALTQSKVSMQDFVDVIRRSATQVDQDGDGSIDMQEFLAATRNLGLPLDVEQVIVLFTYLDRQHVGRISIESLLLEQSSTEAFTSALQVAIRSQIERKGLARFGYFAQQLQWILDGPGDMGEKLQQSLSIVWEGIDSVADAAMCTTDVAGMACAIYGIWQELEGFTSIEELDMSNVCSLMVLMGLSGVQMVRHVSDGQVSDLSELEALLYTQTFEQHRLTVSEFQKLLAYGHVRWERHEPGEAVSADHQGDLWTVVQGSCEVWDGKQHLITERIGCGTVCGGAALLQTAGGVSAATLASGKARATNTAIVAAFDLTSLRAGLERNELLEAKVRRAVAVSMADRLLDAYHAEPRIAG